MPSIVVTPCHPSLSSRHRAFLRRTSPLQSQSISVALAPSLAVHRRRGAVVPYIAFKLPLRHPLPSITVHYCCDRSPSPLPLRLHCPSFYYRRGAAAPSIAVGDPLRRPLISCCAVHHHQVAVHCRQSVHCIQVSVAPSIAIHRRQVAVVPSIAIHHPLLLSLSCDVHCCPRRRAVAVHRPSPASIHRGCAVNCCLSSG